MPLNYQKMTGQETTRIRTNTSSS